MDVAAVVFGTHNFNFLYRTFCSYYFLIVLVRRPLLAGGPDSPLLDVTDTIIKSSCNLFILFI